MNHTIYTADRATHLKVVIVALMLAIAFMGFATALVATSDATTTASNNVEAGGSVQMTSLANMLAR